jgi:hypothetical protein
MTPAAAGCGQREAIEPGAPGAAQVLRSAPLDAALVTPDFGWVLTENQLLVTTDGGASFTESKVDLPAGQGRAAYFTDAEHGWVAAVTGTQALTVARTSDGGNAWEYNKIATTEQMGSLSVGFGTQANGGLLAKMQTSNAFSRGFFFATADGGKSWAATGEAPSAGQVAVEPDGRVWLAGGLVSDHLYTSKDLGRSWAEPTLDVKPTMIGLPRGGVLPVTIDDGTTIRVSLMTSGDAGATWHETSSVPLQADQGVPVPLAVNGSVTLVADNASGQLHRGGKAASSVKSVNAKGLPAGVSRLTLAGENAGWALASNGSCAKGKQSCSITYTIVVTDDAGDSWRELLTWQEKVG